MLNNINQVSLSLQTQLNALNAEWDTLYNELVGLFNNEVKKHGVFDADTYRNYGLRECNYQIDPILCQPLNVSVIEDGQLEYIITLFLLKNFELAMISNSVRYYGTDVYECIFPSYYNYLLSNDSLAWNASEKPARMVEIKAQKEALEAELKGLSNNYGKMSIETRLSDSD